LFSDFQKESEWKHLGAPFTAMHKCQAKTGLNTAIKLRQQHEQTKNCPFPCNKQ